MSKFSVGQAVEKITGDYGGPGVVRGVIQREDGRLRYLVGHQIGGGYGEFLHIYAVGNLRALDDPDLDTKLARVDDAVTQQESFQQRVDPWLMQCFGLTIARDVHERSHRFLEEALELVQANGCTASEAHAIVDYVYGRDQGDINQETGGVMVTLAALCLATGIDLDTAAEKELTRVWDKVETIRAKHFAKPKFSPLPMADDRLARVDGAIAQQLGESIQKNSALANRVTTLRSALATLKEGLIASAAIPDYCSTVLSSDDPEQHG